MERKVGTISRGIRCPIIRENDDLVKITVDSVLEAAESEGFELRDRDVVCLTESIVARAQGNYWEMSSLLYENQPKDFDAMLKLVDKLGLDKGKFKTDFDSKATTAELSEEINNAENLDINATPTMFINGEKIVGIKPYYELKEILIKHGAKQK